MTAIAAQSGEFVGYLDAIGDVGAAAVLREQQHGEGFMANVQGADFQTFRPAAWQEGWLDAEELGAFAPLAMFRANAEI